MFECPPAIQREMDRLRFTCLDEVWQTRHAVYRFQCPQGHVIACKASGLPVLHGCRWCREAEKMQRLQQKAAQDGSQCMEALWLGRQHHYRFRCLSDPSHEWERTYPFALRNARCPHCSRAAYGMRRRDPEGLQRLQASAESKGGECLSPSYLGVDRKHRFRCAQGHIWEAVATHVLGQGTWCRQCGHDDKRRDIEEVQRAAQKRGGRFLSDEYRNTHTRYGWSCAEGHTWQATYRSVQRGAWCPTCIPRSSRLDARALHEAARAQGGQCLSRTYRGVKSKYRWLCSRGHSWYTTLNTVRRGSWCPTCYNMARTKPGSAAWRRYQKHTNSD